MNEKLINEAKNYVNSILMPLENYYYHQYDHALEVMQRAIYLWKKEWLDENDLEELALAWLFHDTGFTISYDNNETIWAKIAQNFLKSKLYPSERIQRIESLILSTNPDYIYPENILQKVIKDADLDNLGRDDFFKKWEKLKRELETIKNIKIKDPDWHHSALDFLWTHKYYTKTQQSERWNKKDENEKILKKLIKKDSKVVIRPNY